jgi:hypothetical protein
MKANKALIECDRMLIRVKMIDLMREKDGISLFAIQSMDGARYVLKFFENETYRREIVHYQQLQSVGISTIPLIATTEKVLLIEDLRYSDTWRLGKAEDMQSEKIASVLAAWYQKLHSLGQTLANDPVLTWYSELDFFSREGFAMAQARTQSQDAELWQILDSLIDPILACIQLIPKTLTYNDFYYVNLAVARDEKSALMFDYNLLGVGFPVMDVGNVCASLSPSAAEAFKVSYGPRNPQEQSLNEIISPLTTLVIGAQREKFPSWFDEAWTEVNKPEFLEKLKRFI